MKLTDTAIRNAKSGEKPVRLFDERGLYLEISPRGGKWWRLKYRFAGKEKRLSLGVYPDVSLKDARDRRDASRKLLVDGIDPSEHSSGSPVRPGQRLSAPIASMQSETRSYSLRMAREAARANGLSPGSSISTR